KPLLLKLLAADVIHDWWIPQFGNKMDMVPTQENFLWLTIKKPGEYWGICSEFCGAQHAHMRLKVVADTEDDYNQWLLAYQSTTVQNTSEGARLFQSMTCAGCHRISGTSARGRAGPDLSHLGSRSTLLAGLLVNNEQNLERFIRHPQQIKPGAHMPNFLLDDTTASQLAAYLYSLK
ncbi:MAG TPA: cytochrome c oxidase subunit II, partial [Flavisolibacter sp.]|nr:cytochrome c oxidase subunit II [Flavisolibacter sp.]